MAGGGERGQGERSERGRGQGRKGRGVRRAKEVKERGGGGC